MNGQDKPNKFDFDLCVQVYVLPTLREDEIKKLFGESTFSRLPEKEPIKGQKRYNNLILKLNCPLTHAL